jgi:hypothetical protein
VAWRRPDRPGVAAWPRWHASHSTSCPSEGLLARKPWCNTPSGHSTARRASSVALACLDSVHRAISTRQARVLIARCAAMSLLRHQGRFGLKEAMTGAHEDLGHAHLR